MADLCTLWEGVDFDTYDSGRQLMRCALLCVGCDLPAARKVCGFLSYTASLGCSKCYCNFGTGIFGKQDYSGFDRDNWNLRSNEMHRDNIKTILSSSSKSEQRNYESEFGCRYSCLLQLPYFDVVRMSIIDPMHNLYLGTAKRMFSIIWINDMLDGTSIQLVNERIASLIVPPEVRFSRLPASMNYPSSLTAEQWMLWVNYYSIYCLYELIPHQHLDCWRNFVLASRILCQKQLSNDEIKLADTMLLQFCNQFFQTLYGPDSVTPNIHLHAHLVDCVVDYGPMSSFWLFSFERFNGILGDEPTNNRSIEVQLMSRFMQDNFHLQLLNSIPSASQSITTMFSHAVLDHACSFTSKKYLDVSSSTCYDQVEQLLPASKYTIWSFSEAEVKILQCIYLNSYPSLYSESADMYFPCCYHKMPYVTINGQKIKSGHYILAKSV